MEVGYAKTLLKNLLKTNCTKSPSKNNFEKILLQSVILSAKRFARAINDGISLAIFITNLTSKKSNPSSVLNSWNSITMTSPDVFVRIRHSHSSLFEYARGHPGEAMILGELSRVPLNPQGKRGLKIGEPKNHIKPSLYSRW